jgi:hypothetical protein
MLSRQALNAGIACFQALEQAIEPEVRKRRGTGNGQKTGHSWAI